MRLDATSTARPMATPRETGRPNTWIVILLTFAELVLDQCAQGVHRCLLVLTVGLDFDLAAGTGGQHHHAHDALGVDAAAVAAHVNVALKTARQLGQLGRCAGVQAELIADRDGRLDHRWTARWPGSADVTRRLASRPG